MCINTRLVLFCLNMRIIVFCKSLFGCMQKFDYYSVHHLREQLCLWNWLCSSSENNALSSRSLFPVWPSPRCIVTCTRTFTGELSKYVQFARSESPCRVASPTALRVHSFPSLVMVVFASKYPAGVYNSATHALKSETGSAPRGLILWILGVP